MMQKNCLAMYWKTGKAGKKLKGKDWGKVEEIEDFSSTNLYKNRNDIRERS
jgi:hypothetical protein